MSTKLQTTSAPERQISDLDEVHGRFRLRFAKTAADLDRVFRLRYDVFNLELEEGLDASRATGRDTDEFDPFCQHVMVEEVSSGRVIGTYRMQRAVAAREARGLYVETEFDLSGLPSDVQSQMVEAGRACIAKEFRIGRVLLLLWRGLVAYMDLHECRYLVGCSSLTSQDPMDGLWMERQLGLEGSQHASYNARPRPGFECVANGSIEEHPPLGIPKLFGTYLRYGARMLGSPAIDRRFKTIDFLTFMDLAELTPEALEQLS